MKVLRVCVIGDHEAKLELFKASKSWTKEDRIDIEERLCGLGNAFCWSRTIQGVKFWDNICKALQK